MPRSRLKRLFQFRIGYRLLILTLGLALATWFVIASGDQYEFDEEIPVRMRGLQEQGKMLVTRELPPVTTRIRGRGWSLWQEFLFHRAWYDLQLSPTGPRDLNVELTPERVMLPAAVNLSPVAILEPRRLQLLVDDIGTDTLEVAPQLELNLMAGYRLVDAPRVTPARVGLTAPVTILDTLDRIQTESLRLDDLDSPREIMADLVIPFNHLELEQRQVAIQLEVEPVLELRFRTLPVQVANLPQSVRVLPDPPFIDALMAGATSRILELTEDQLTVTVDFEDWRPEAPYLRPQVTHPPEVELITTTPHTVKLRMIVQ